MLTKNITVRIKRRSYQNSWHEKISLLLFTGMTVLGAKQKKTTTSIASSSCVLFPLCDTWVMGLERKYRRLSFNQFPLFLSLLYPIWINLCHLYFFPIVGKGFVSSNVCPLRQSVMARPNSSHSSRIPSFIVLITRP